MDGLSKLGATLTAVFAVLVAALFAELLYVLWRRQRFRLRSLGDGGRGLFVDTFYKYMHNKSRVEPDSAPTRPGNISADPAPAEAVDELEKWQRLYGPSRMLFTIKEEEREGLESDYSVSDEVFGFEFVAGGSGPDEEEATPFSTPCGSPPYYTPSPSPSPSPGREAVVDLPESPTFEVRIR